ncbi:hypothetical protein HID58_043013, partial [Brassica napus]
SCHSKTQCCINFNLKRYGSPITQLQNKNFEKKKMTPLPTSRTPHLVKIQTTSLMIWNRSHSVHTLDEDTSNISPGSYFNNLGLKYFASEPLRMVSRMVSRHKRLTESCLENNNPEALKHLRHSAHGIYNKDTLEWEHTASTSNCCWRKYYSRGHVFKQHGKAQTPKKLRPPRQESSMQKVLLLKVQMFVDYILYR